MKEKLPIKFFAKREEDKQRVEGMGSKELPKFVLYGNELNEKSANYLKWFLRRWRKIGKIETYLL